MSEDKGRDTPPNPPGGPVAPAWQHGHSNFITVAWCRTCGRTYPLDHKGKLCSQPKCPSLPLLKRNGIICPESRCNRFVTQGNLKRHQLTHLRNTEQTP